MGDSSPGKKPSFFSRPVFRRAVVRASLGGAILFFLVGVVFWGGFNTAMEETNTLEFCIGCHEMHDNVYEEYTPTIHYSNRTGVRATCSDCHVPDPWVHKVVRKIQASKELYHKMLGSVDTPEKFDAKRLLLAKRVWKVMKEADSRECRNCHNLESMSPEKQKPRAQKQHMLAFEKGYTCIDCHKGIAHKSVHKEMSDEELTELEKPTPEFIRPIPDQWVAYFAEQEAAKQAKLAAKKKPAKPVVVAASPPIPAEPVSEVGTGMVDWSDVPEREVVMFYPGESSMEWILTGRDHSGVRAFNYGDRCFDCHDQEAVDIGRKIVTGEKLEPNVIPNKRGSIPVRVQAAHDSEHLYLRFQWPDTEHAPVPFVEGGKMDPDNPIKLAMMLATDDVEYADRAGCWGTCHHDLRSMPGAPAGEALGASPHAGTLDFTDGVTKYIAESRTEVEIKGEEGKARGACDKLKSAGDLDGEMQADRFMDLLRYKSGTGETEDGHVLAERVMSGGQGMEASGELNDGIWTVVLKRRLASDKAGDLSLALDQTYNIGFAIHDDYSTARYHHVSVDYDLGFDNDEAEINAIGQ